MRYFDWKSLVVRHLGYLSICTIRHNWDHAIFFLRYNGQYALITICTTSVSDFSTDREVLKQYLIVGRYLGAVADPGQVKINYSSSILNSK